MSQQSVTWTALPNGLSPARSAGGILQLSVFVTPKLTSDPSAPNLGAFPDFLDWPAYLSKIQFQVAIQGGPTPAPNATVTSQPSSAVWKALFNSETYVEPYQYDSFSDRQIRSFPVSSIQSFLASTYATVATG